ncbi:MAG: DegV family protein [Oscillospiraceae bacterium]|nr:DegV family protein [Oscillospiraceae bacterium]
MSKIKITCDSTCDLTKELYEKYDISVMPLAVNLGDDLYRDGVDIDGPMIFDYVAKTGILPKTSAVSIAEYTDFFKPWVDDGYEVIHINLSSGLSSCHQNACLAAEELGNIYVIDSLNLSSGSGHLAIAGAELAAEGFEAKEIAEKLNEMKTRLDVSFIIQELDYLHKGGRCSGVAAFGANLLKLRPCIEVVDGGMIVGKKYRGSTEKTIKEYIDGRLAGREDLQLNRIFLTHSHAPQEIVDKMLEYIKELQPFAEVIETVAGSTITSHCGKACLGVLFFKK